MRELTPEQMAWLADHPRYRPVGPPRPGVQFVECGTLYADGTFIMSKPMQPTFLGPGCLLVGIPAYTAEFANPQSK